MKNSPIIITLLATVFLASCGGKDKKTAVDNSPAISVTVSQISENTNSPYLSVSGKIQSEKSATLIKRMIIFAKQKCCIYNLKNFIFIPVFFMLFKPVLPVIDYLINYDYISTVLCENIEVPELKCNGQCYLSKELAKTSDIEKPIDSHKKNHTNFEIELLFNETIQNAYLISNIAYKKENIVYKPQKLYFSDFSTTIFHPPIFLT